MNEGWIMYKNSAISKMKLDRHDEFDTVRSGR